MTTDPTEVQGIVRKYHEQQFANKLVNLDEMDKFLEKHNLPKGNHEKSENLNRQITTNEMEEVIKKKTQQIKVLGQIFHK